MFIPPSIFLFCYFLIFVTFSSSRNSRMKEWCPKKIAAGELTRKDLRCGAAKLWRCLRCSETYHRNRASERRTKKRYHKANQNHHRQVHIEDSSHACGIRILILPAYLYSYLWKAILHQSPKWKFRCPMAFISQSGSPGKFIWEPVCKGHLYSNIQLGVNDNYTSLHTYPSQSIAHPAK